MWDTIVKSTPEIVGAGIKYSIPLALISFVIAMVIAVVTALVRTTEPKGSGITKFLFKLLKWIISFYIWLFRSTPLLVQLFIVFFGLPSIGVELDAFTAGIITFSLNTGAYCSESVRGAIISIPKSQWEAAYAIGMSYSQVLFRIIFPQAMRVAIPPVSNSFIGLVKDTSLASSITILEMFTVSQQIAAKNYEPMLMYCMVAVYYAVFCSILSIGQYYLERYTSRYIVTGG